VFEFQVNQQYANRNGRYTVLAVKGDQIHVRYDDGKEAHLKINIQARIWNNMTIEQQVSAARRNKRRDAVHRSVFGDGEQAAGYYIKIINAPLLDEFNFPGWADNVLMVPDEEQAAAIHPDDRILIYVLNAGTFVASVTVTGDAQMESPKVYFYPAAISKKIPLAPFFPIEVDSAAKNLMDGISYNAVGIDKLADFNKQLKKDNIEAESLIKIDENYFESIAELLLDLSDDDEDDEDEYELLDDDDDDDGKDADEEDEEIDV